MIYQIIEIDKYAISLKIVTEKRYHLYLIGIYA